MAFDFPSSPTIGEIYQNYQWDGEKWLVLPGTETGFLPLTGGTLSGDLTLNADPTVALHAATKQYVDASASLTDAPSDGKFYVRQDAAWVEVPRYQRYACDGVTSVDIPVPSGAVVARLTGHIVPTSATSVVPVLQVSVAASVFLAATTDYVTNGFYQGAAASTVIAVNNSSILTGMQVANSNTSANFVIIFDGMMKVKRHDATAGRFSGDFRAMTNSTSIYHNFFHVHVTQTNLGSATSLLGLRLKSETGSNWGADSFVSVEWL